MRSSLFGFLSFSSYSWQRCLSFSKGVYNKMNNNIWYMFFSLEHTMQDSVFYSAQDKEHGVQENRML